MASPAPSRPVDLLPAWGAGAAFGLLFALYAAAVGYVCDDGFIVYQYVKNFAAGEGFVYAPGLRVEGYTGFLWVGLLGVLARLLPLPIPVLGAVLGVASGVASLVLVVQLSRTVARTPWPWSLLAAGLLAVNGAMVTWSTSGLETLLFAFLLLAAAGAYAGVLERGRPAWPVPLLFALLAMTRPEGMLFFGLTSLHFWVREIRAGRSWIGRPVWIWAGLFLGVFLPWYLARWAWYGDPLPNTAYVKLGHGTEMLRLGLRYVTGYLVDYGLLLYLPAALVLLRRPRVAWRDYLALLVGAYTAYVVYAGGDGLGSYRFSVHVAPLLFLLVQEGWADLYARLRDGPFVRRGPLLAGLAMLAVAASVWSLTRHTLQPLWLAERVRWTEPHSELTFPGRGEVHDYVWFDTYFVDRLAAAARWLDAHAPDGSLVASTPAGSIAYHMRHPVLDMLGLNDRHIARTEPGHVGWARPGHFKGDGAYVLDREPAYILMGNVAVLARPLDRAAVEEKLVRKSEHEIWADPRFHRDYERVVVHLAEEGPFQWFTFYRRRGVADGAPAADELADDVGA